MKTAIISFLLSLFILAGCANPSSQTGEENKSVAQKLFDDLMSITGKATLFGHQDDLAYGIGWKYVDGESDVKRTAGDYPALFGWELGGIELGHEMNLDSVPFNKMRQFAIWAHQNGGVNTFSWHPFSALDESKSSWVTDEKVVKHILPGGSHHEVFLKHMDKLVAFFKELNEENGEKLPFIFRPWHEMDGGWFWWGADLTTPDEMKELFRFTIDYMWEQGLDNFLVAYSPDRFFNSIDEYLTWYPGDEYVHVIGVDNYYDMRRGPDGLQDAILKLEIAAKYAKETGKIAAFTETGLDTIPDENWYTQSLAKVLNANEWTRRMAYVMVWRNHDLDHFYVPHPQHPAADDFRQFTSQQHIWLLNDWANYQQK
ncbi:glycoside hydrolase family 26 protein [Alkalitalea saponilacus]|uniref:Mannan endo-1,4-beta-mannosidase n=1 Tax=Alkalitalea saponilacus TaxID=889453 RepID=A0A1T5HTA4_9BACT|nr:glycosyl hydrolase [Alkalitalea saponilacus]ASB48952.1 beta-mannosidase [Alkalitalea saponilacus]SKC23903.1 mannan endo-1,4-beta-mannosidase [Alkalitalea saponilacus]